MRSIVHKRKTKIKPDITWVPRGKEVKFDHFLVSRPLSTIGISVTPVTEVDHSTDLEEKIFTNYRHCGLKTKMTPVTLYPKDISDYLYNVHRWYVSNRLSLLYKTNRKKNEVKVIITEFNQNPYFTSSRTPWYEIFVFTVNVGKEESISSLAVYPLSVLDGG